jgi:membrane-associated phospholipid phosphatase
LNLSTLRYLFWLLALASFLVSHSAGAQVNHISNDDTVAGPTDSLPEAPPSNQGPPPDCSLKRLDKCLVNVAVDQAGIWTSPLRFHSDDILWFVPFAAATGVSLHYDATAMRDYSFPTSAMNFGHQVSRFSAPYVSFGAASAIYLLGSVSHKPRVEHAGLLGAEAVVDAEILAEGLKLATNRDRPYQGDGTGKFWPHGTRSYNLDSSMPSAHVLAAWALARVISSDFGEKPWLKLLCYGAASTVSASRVLSRDHFPSDVIVGSVFGYLVGGYVVRHRSDRYWDSIIYSVHPAVDTASHGVGISLNIPLP